MDPTSKTARVLLSAVARGYTVTDDGVVYGLRKQPLSVNKRGNQRYPTISVKTTETSSTIFGIPAHMLAAYCFYGEEVFKEGVEIRHLSGDTEDVSKQNIVLGTSSENQYDKAPHKRQYAAKRARTAQPTEGHGAKLTHEQVREIRDFYCNCGGKPAKGTVSALAKKLGVNKNALGAIKSGKTWSHLSD